MRTVTIALLVSWLMLAAGCQPKPPTETIWRADAEGLLVEAIVPSRTYVRGQTLTLNVAASNTTKSDMTIAADSGALVCVKLWRRTSIGWEQVKSYPAAAVMVASPWKLAARRTHNFTLNLPIEPDWPTGEPLKLTAELNGRPAVAPGGLIRIFATQADYNEALKD